MEGYIWRSKIPDGAAQLLPLAFKLAHLHKKLRILIASLDQTKLRENQQKTYNIRDLIHTSTLQISLTDSL